jgi:hypothetical protein
VVRERHRRDDGRPGDYDADCRARGAGEPVALAGRGARDFHLLMGGDVPSRPRSTNTARFPYLEPFGEMLSVAQKRAGSLVDGGYFENEGLQTALELAEWLSAQSTPDQPVLPIIVQATGDREADVTRTEVMTCDTVSDGAFIPDDRHSGLQNPCPADRALSRAWRTLGGALAAGV